MTDKRLRQIVTIWMKLEGIVSKRRDAPYRSGKQSDWIIKCATWREANKERWRLFECYR